MSEYPQNVLEDWNVLVVEDDPISMDIVRRILSAYGARVYYAVNGKNALDILERIDPQFILSDLSMPIMDGWHFIEAVRADPRYTDLPVFALTAHAMNGDREKAISAGFHNYMTKPFTVETFMDDLMSLLDEMHS